MGEVRVGEETSGRDRITEVRIQGMRALADVRLPLGGLTVLIGENGSGKSTIIEALELLRRAAQPGNFVVDQLGPFHGGLDALLRAGEDTLRIGVSIEGGGPRIDYTFALTKRASATIISDERLESWEPGALPQPLPLIFREGTLWKFVDAQRGQLRSLPPVAPQPGELALQAVLRTQGTASQPAAERVRSAFDTGRVHVRFYLRPLWVEGSTAPMRFPVNLRVADELERLGGNLANCYHRLWNSSPPEVWERVMERVRAGLGPGVVSIKTPAVGPAQIELVVNFQGVPKPISALALSDGQLAYLAFVALTELGKDHGFVAFDEPESHLHPGLLVRVVWLLEELAESCPVILATQSDRLLDALYEPAKSVVLCELTEDRATRLVRPDPVALEKWLARYRGLGELRSQGYEPHIFRKRIGNGE